MAKLEHHANHCARRHSVSVRLTAGYNQFCASLLQQASEIGETQSRPSHALECDAAHQSKYTAKRHLLAVGGGAAVVGVVSRRHEGALPLRSHTSRRQPRCREHTQLAA